MIDTMSVTEQIVSRAYAGAPLRDFTPVEIDTAAYHLYEKLVRIEGRISSNRSAILAETKRAERLGREPRIGHLTESILRDEEEQANIQVSYDALDAEYVRRGCWTRAFLVSNANGHVHRSMSCSTCFVTTQYHWVTEFSGKTEAEVIEAAGERACTVCYPDAPVGAKGTSIFTPDEVAKAEARRQREEAKAAREAAQVVVENWQDGERFITRVFKTERGLTNELSSIVMSLTVFGEQHPTATEWLWNLQEGRKVAKDWDLAKSVARARKQVASPSKWSEENR